ANCQDVTLQLDANGNASTTANAINNGSTDNCGIASISLDKTEFDCSDLGNNIVTLTVTDVNNNSSTCTAGVTIEDEITPTAVCQDYTLQLNGKSNTVDPVSVDGGSYDNCGIANFILDRTSFSCDDIGTAHDVILTVEDQAGLISACRATITVEAGIALPDDFSTASIGSSFGDALHNACEEAFYLSSGQTSTYNYTEGWGEMTYVNLSGDFTFTAEVKSMSSNSVAGIMVRHGSSSGDMMGFVAKHGYTMTGGVTLNGNGKVVRTRSGRASRTIVFTVTRIGDRLTFKQGRTTLLVMDLDMGSNAMVGLFLSSSNDEEATATFHNVSYSSSTNSSFTQATNSEMFPYEGAGDGSSSTKESKASPISELESGVSNNKSTLSSLSRQGDEFKVYPNPTQGQITIDLQAIIGNSAVLNVYNMVGQQVYSENMGMVYDAQKQLDLSNLEKGTYLITIESAGQLLQQKIVLQK
ncbi:MAG: T9SS type A sorting domain-containing protein, partial [Bacteroidota bacterium]